MDEEQIDMMLTASNFYIKEADKLLKKIDSAKSRKAKLKYLVELRSLKSKISFEISQINKIMEENQ